jgi:succinate-semialdehyde dehydrogenase / glutarate-semialdehyde dehydrogenase
MRRLVVGDPLDPATDIGPLATEQIRDDLDDQVRRAVAAGGRLLMGGRVRPGAGYFYEPTVIVDVVADSPVFREETFGPVAAISRSRDLDHAIELANDSQFGLGASAWTREESEMDEFARRLAAGSVFINGMVASDPRFPFGGIKKSGFGRELGVFGIREFVNIKTVRMMLGDGNAGGQAKAE